MSDTSDLLDKARDLVKIETLYVNDAEMIRRLGIPYKTATRLIQSMDANPHSGFPQKDKLCGDRRHWPSVMKFFEELSRSNPQGRSRAS